MAVTTSPSYHGSPIHDGFATIRAPRSRIKIRNLVEPNNVANLPQRHSEYFTLQRNSPNNFLDSSVVVQYTNNETVNNGNDADKPLRLSFTEPIYAKVTPPHSKSTSPVKRINGKAGGHNDCTETKPRRRLKSLEYTSGTDLFIDEKNGIALSNGERLPSEQYAANQDSSELHSVRTDTTGSSVDYRKRHSDRDNCSESSSYLTDNDRPISSYSDNSTIPSTDTEDVLKDLPNKSRFHKSPQKFATLNLRRPKFIDLKQTGPKETQFYGSLQRNKMGYHSEPNTPLSGDRIDLNDETSLLDQIQKIPRMPLQSNRNGFRRSISENNGFSKRLNYRHSFSADYRTAVIKKPHKCCECVTGIPAEEEETPTTRTLGTLYETQDPKVGCQTILRSKPPIPWWELAIKKSRYKSCPILEEAHVVSAFEQSLSNMTQRLQQLTATAERKDSELTELRQTIELLRKQSIQAGLTTAHMQSMGIRADGVNVTGQEPSTQVPQSSPQRNVQAGNGAITRHLSTDSVSSINSLSSGSSMPHDKKHKKKGWLRSSFTKAFSRNAKISKTAKHSSLGQLSSQDSSSGSHHYDDPHTIREGSNENSLEHSHEALPDTKDRTTCPNSKTDDQTKDKPDDSGLVDELKRQLREKDLVLTDIRLEALSSAHQLESLKDTVIKMRNEMLNLKQNNERLQRLVTSRSLAGSQSSLPASDDPRRFSLADQPALHQASMDMHSQPLDLDFNCTLSSTPTMDFSKKNSPKSNMVEPIYGNKAVCELNENNEAILGALNGSSDIFTNGLSTGDRMSGDYDINTVLPPPKTRELAIGESYSDIGVADSQGDTTDGKKIAIAVYLGQPETFQRYFEEVQDTLTESECRFYAKQSAAAFNHFEKQSSYDSPRMSQNHSPDTETQDYPQSVNKSNTNSLKSNKSTHSNSYKNVYHSDSTINCNEFTIAYTYISGKTTWQNLDYIVRKTFKDYLSRIDPGTNLGLNTDSITSYHLGEATRGPEIGFPELLPCGYIIGTVNTLYICLQGVGSLAFDSLIPKNIVYRYVSLLSEHRRVILCGPSGTGKSYLAAKLAEFYVQRTQRRGNPAEAVATFNVDRKSCNELRAYLANIAEQCGAAGAEEAALPSVVLLDNLQHASALGDAFAGLLPPDNRNMPVIIGTMSQATCNTTNLQLHHNFRWLLTANHMEPVKGFLARYLRRKLFSLELRLGRREPALAAVLEWLPGVWSTLNAFLEAHSSSDVTVGPRLFLACPMDLEASQAWFADVWNYSIVPYASEAVREGVALYGRRRHAAVDPLHHVKSSYPWREPNHSHTLRAITVEEMSIEEANQEANRNNNQDPLLNMLMRLQEAANYSGNQSQDSDNASMDSNLTHDSSMGNEL